MTYLYRETSFVIWQLELIKIFYFYKSSRIDKEICPVDDGNTFSRGNAKEIRRVQNSAKISANYLTALEIPKGILQQNHMKHYFVRNRVNSLLFFEHYSFY